ncbi:MAG: alpha-E domain-containing protein, partial [Acidimicrobiia bacterium]|nr:alpha-E domain-containing protein [Acidimicrobiia bacterium]
GTVAQAINRMFDAVEVLRDQLSVDTWLVIGSMQGRLERLESVSHDRDDAVVTVLNGLLESLLALSGLMAESMVRDHAWQFMEVGRRVERALQITALVGALLTVDYEPAAESLIAESTLTAAESIITYRRRYRSHAQIATVLDLLLSDPGNPRSLRFQLDRLDEGVGALDAARRRDADAAALAKVRAALELLEAVDSTRVAEVADGHRLSLQTFLWEMRQELLGIAEAIGADNFTRLLPQQSMSTPSEPPGWST